MSLRRTTDARRARHRDPMRVLTRTIRTYEHRTSGVRRIGRSHGPRDAARTVSRRRVKTPIAWQCVGRARIRGAWALKDPDLAEQRLELLASELERTWPDAAASLKEGTGETLTLMRLGIGGQLAKTLCSTNACESMIEIVRHTQRNVKRRHDGDMRKRWTAAGMLQAEQQFRRIIGYRDLAKLVVAIERHAARAASPSPTTTIHTKVPQTVTV